MAAGLRAAAAAVADLRGNQWRRRHIRRRQQGRRHEQVTNWSSLSILLRCTQGAWSTVGQCIRTTWNFTNWSPRFTLKYWEGIHSFLPRTDMTISTLARLFTTAEFRSEASSRYANFVEIRSALQVLRRAIYVGRCGSLRSRSKPISITQSDFAYRPNLSRYGPSSYFDL